MHGDMDEVVLNLWAIEFCPYSYRRWFTKDGWCKTMYMFDALLMWPYFSMTNDMLIDNDIYICDDFVNLHIFMSICHWS